MRYPQRCLALVTLLALPHAANAQEGADFAVRRQLLEQAQAARTAGDHVRALDMANRAGALRMTPSLRMFIAQEETALGHLANALGTAQQCEQEIQRDASVPNREQILATCQQIERDLRPRVGEVTVHMPDQHPAGVQVTVAGHAVSEVLYGVPYVVTPGSVIVEAELQGQVVFHREIAVGAHSSVDVNIELPAHIETASNTSHTTTSANTSSSSPSPEATQASNTQTSTSSQNQTVTTTGSSQESSTPHDTAAAPLPIVPIAVAGVGVLGLIGAGVFAGLRGSALGNCTISSGTVYCPTQADIDRAHAAPGYSYAMDISLGVGIVAIVGAAALWFFTRPSPSNHQHAAIDLTPTAGGAVLTFRGAL